MFPFRSQFFFFTDKGKVQKFIENAFESMIDHSLDYFQLANSWFLNSCESNPSLFQFSLIAFEDAFQTFG